MDKKLKLSELGRIVKTIYNAKSRSDVDTPKQKNPLNTRGFTLFCGLDGTRTRDPRRDRPIF